MPHTFPAPLPFKHNQNLKYKITKHQLVFVCSKCDFWTSDAKKPTSPKFQLHRFFRPEVIKENINSKWQILVRIRYYVQIFK